MPRSWNPKEQWLTSREWFEEVKQYIQKKDMESARLLTENILRYMDKTEDRLLPPTKWSESERHLTSLGWFKKFRTLLLNEERDKALEFLQDVIQSMNKAEESTSS